MTKWIARDRNGSLWRYDDEPEWLEEFGIFHAKGRHWKILPSHEHPEINPGECVRVDEPLTTAIQL